MKKLYFFFVMLLSLCGATTAFAQTEVTLTLDMDNGKWVQWNGNESNPYARTWNSTTTPKLSICSRNGGFSDVVDIRGNKANGANNMAPWGDNKKQLMFYNQYGSAGFGKYEIAVENGWFIKSVDFDFNSSVDAGTGVSIFDGEEILSAGPDDIQHVSMVAEDEETYIVPFTVTQKGTNGFARTSSFYVVVGKLGEAQTALEELRQALTTYEGYKFLAGDEPGNYREAEVNAFYASIDAAHNADDNPNLDGMPDAELVAYYRSLVADIKAAYEAVLAARNTTLTLADGYYRIKTGMRYYTTETITDPETTEETTVTTYVDKYMKSVLDGQTIYGRWGSTDELSSDCSILWKVTSKDGYYDIQNMATDSRFNDVETSAAQTMSLTSENLMAIEPVATYEGVTYANIRVSTQAAGGSLYLHQNKHNAGKGTGDNLVGWSTSFSYDTNQDNPVIVGGTEWVFEPVADNEAQEIIKNYEPIKNEVMMKERYKIMIADAKEKLEIARDIHTQIDGTPLITDVAQLSSPYTEESEGSLEALLDGNASTYWHSDWTNNTATAPGIHYLQAEITEVDVTTIAAVFTRRPVTGNHVTELGVFGTNDPEAEKDACEDLVTLSTPYGVNTETITTAPFDTKGYKYLRFYVNANSNGNYIMHMSEFQLYRAQIDASYTTQATVMGDIFTNLENVVKEQADLEIEDLTEVEYNALKEAYDAFIAVFVDPTTLRETLENLKDMSNIIVVGDQPGFWSADNGAASFKALYEEAVAYDKAGAYTEEKSQGYVDSLNKQSEDIYASANKIQTGKWYRIRFASEEEFDNYGWDKVAGNAQVTGGIQTSAEMFGKYIVAAEISTETKSYEDEEGESHDVTVYTVKTEDGADVLGLGDRLYFAAKDEIVKDDDLDLFRFIAVGDSAYLLQNKGTNLFLKAAGGSGAVSLSVHPSLFNVRAIGYGENVIAAKSFTGENQNYLHGQVAANMLVTWNAYTPGSRSGFYIEEAGDVTSDYEGKDFNMPILYGALNTFCYPMELATKEGQMWSVNGVDMENNSITLVKIQKAVGGRPFIYINGKTEDYDAEEETEMITFTHGYSIDGIEPQTSSFLKGTYSSIVIDRGDIYCSGNEFKVNTVEKDAIMVELTRVGANHAYISAETPFSTTEGLDVIWDENTTDAIQAALTNVSHSGALYTIDGRLVSKKATLNDIQKFGKGLYILNGTKVLVK